MWRDRGGTMNEYTHEYTHGRTHGEQTETKMDHDGREPLTLLPIADKVFGYFIANIRPAARVHSHLTLLAAPAPSFADPWAPTRLDPTTAGRVPCQNSNAPKSAAFLKNMIMSTWYPALPSS